MAALIIHSCSILEQVYRIGCVFIRTNCSISDCWQFIVNERRQFLINQYLKEIINNNYKSAILPASRKMNDDILEFVHIEEPVVEEFYDLCKTAAMVDCQMIQDAGLVFSCSTIGEITPGTSFYINGTILKNCERFSINLTAGPFNKDIALHINPRLPQNYIVRNCKINSYWGNEEVTSALPFSLNRGDKFAMQILCTESEYYLSLNGQHFASFSHRIPYNRVNCLQVKGDVMDIQVEQLSVMSYPDKMCGNESSAVKIMEYISDNELENLNSSMTVPHYGKLLKNFKIGTRLHIVGRVKVLPHSFFVNLQKGDKIWPHPIIAFHLNPRFANVGGKHVICRNSWINGEWGREERSETVTDFMPGRKFHLSISCNESSFLVYLNNKFIAEYHFRIEPSTVDMVYIQGDLKLYSVILETSPVITEPTSFYNDIDSEFVEFE